MTVDTRDRWVFLAEGHSLARVNFDGSGLLTLEGLNVIGQVLEGIAVDPVGRKLYWLSMGGLYRSNLDLTSPEPLVTLSYPVELDLDPVTQRLRWSETTGNRIASLAIGGTTPAYVDYGAVNVIFGEVLACPP